ncbi:hypothetical protein PGTUg99_025647 [Puccinia graminis f. sp. tritici]|nr:hypothetical protein PGTUg99_025647 [Puccinia graminis f. sp. tritici]
MANLVIPPWRGKVYPPQLIPLQYHNSGTTSYHPPPPPEFYQHPSANDFYHQPPVDYYYQQHPEFYQHPSANAFYHQPPANAYYQQPPANNLPLNPGPMRNPQASERKDLDPLEPQAPLSPQNNGSNHGGPETRQENIGLSPTHLGHKKSLLTHSLEREPEMPEHTGARRKIVKIKPLDKRLFFDGNNMPIEEFISQYEEAGEYVGASSQDLANQILPFIRGPDLQDEVEEMYGYENSNWKTLKEELMGRFAMKLTLEECAREELVDLVSYVANMGGISTPDHFKPFRSQFEQVTHYLIINGYNSHMDEFSKLFWQSLSQNLEKAISDPLIWDGHLVLDDNFHIAELPPYNIILEYIDMEFEKMDILQEAPGQAEQKIQQPNQHYHTVTKMEECNPEIHSPLTEHSSPELSPNLDLCPLILQNDPSLEHLEKEETKNFGSETEILPAKIHSEISSPYCALIEDNCSPVVSAAMEFSPQLPQNCEELDPLEKYKKENPAPKSPTFEEGRPTEEEKLPPKILPQEALPIGQVEDSPDKPVHGFSKFLEILEEQYTVEDISKTEDSSTFQETEGTKLGLVLDSKHQPQYPRKDIMVVKPEGIGTK